MVSGYGIGLHAQHAKLLEDSAIPPEFARTRGYVTVTEKTRLAGLGEHGISKAGRNVPGLLVPLRRKDGSVWGYQYRPDLPRIDAKGRGVKYESPINQRAGLDVPPGVGPLLHDPAVPLLVTEGSRKADSAAALGLACVSLSGVDCWRGTNAAGGRVALPEWADVALNGRRVMIAFDSDATRKGSVRYSLRKLADYLGTKDARVEFLWLPNDGDTKTGLDDFIAAGHGVNDLWALVRPDPPPVAEQAEIPDADLEPEPRPEPRTVRDVHLTFRRWMGKEYDFAALDAVLATAAAERLDGDPPWLLMISGSGNAKTETVSALLGAGAHIVSTITGEAALLSGTATRDRIKDATGGLLRKIGDRGLLVIKDVTSILSMSRDRRNDVLGALREIADGRWGRDVGVDGGRSLSWTGRAARAGVAYREAQQPLHRVPHLLPVPRDPADVLCRSARPWPSCPPRSSRIASPPTCRGGSRRETALPLPRLRDRHQPVLGCCRCVRVVYGQRRRLARCQGSPARLPVHRLP